MSPNRGIGVLLSPSDQPAMNERTSMLATIAAPEASIDFNTPATGCKTGAIH